MAAGDQDLLDRAGVQVSAAQLDGADAGAVVGGQVTDDLAGAFAIPASRKELS
jgi:hypothetical protein